MNTQLLQGEELDAFYNRVMVQKDIDEYGDAVDYVPQEAVVQRIKLIIALAIRWLGIEMYVEPDEVEAITIEWPTEDEPVSFCVYRDDDSFYMVYRPDERVDKQFYFDYTLDHEKISESAEAY